MSRNASRSWRREIGCRSVELALGMRERPHCLAPRGMISRVARMTGIRRWSDLYQMLGRRARMFKV